jgi:hypothetical protein
MTAFSEDDSSLPKNGDRFGIERHSIQCSCHGKENESQAWLLIKTDKKNLQY